MRTSVFFTPEDTDSDDHSKERPTPALIHTALIYTVHVVILPFKIFVKGEILMKYPSATSGLLFKYFINCL